MKVILLISSILILFSGCLAGGFPDTHTENLKEQHDYNISQFQGATIYYFDENGYIQQYYIHGGSSSFYIIKSNNNKTYLRHEKWGGLADMNQWTLYIS